MEEPTNYIKIEGLDKEGIEKLLQALEQEHTDKFKEQSKMLTFANTQHKQKG